MAKMHNIIRTSILVLIITVLITPYAESCDHCRGPWADGFASNHQSIFTTPHDHDGSGTPSTADYPHNDEHHDQHFHHKHNGPIESAETAVPHSAWHCSGKSFHFHYLDNVLPADEIKEDDNTSPRLDIAATSFTQNHRIESAGLYLKQSDHSSSSHHIKWLILNSTDLPPPLIEN
ncbi:hypothetical protein Desal_1505 [Maridesulfovibrio salexigens DSM 2638]|uniref:Uncharacterized protein n=1 Tax=Maridesulfovibrio salexigens (strain ATCC 14822 / DSM 2638 / NCIMB 8403 / VKM B-1763) TaxID=526222 RepID=C6BS91_MARSD|nr:hypothetical protein Desal_1505 [Maridesulfovibrio salexigens DSM 2638]